MPTRSPARSLAACEPRPCPPSSLPSLASYLAEVPDTRSPRGWRHPMPALICLMLS